MPSCERRLERLVERVRDAWIAAARADASERDECGDAADRADLVGEELLRQRRPFVPASVVDEDGREPRADVRRVEVVLGRERDELVRPALRLLELVHLAEAGRQHRRTRSRLANGGRAPCARSRLRWRYELPLSISPAIRYDVPIVLSANASMSASSISTRELEPARRPSERPRRCLGSACGGSPGRCTRTHARCRAVAARGSRSPRDSLSSACVVQAERDRRGRQSRQVHPEPEPIVERSRERDCLAASQSSDSV